LLVIKKSINSRY